MSKTAKILTIISIIAVGGIIYWRSVKINK
jgi:hypothetical protein